MKAKLKICGMKEPANISAAAALKPDYLGFIFYPGSKRFVDGLDAVEIRNVPAGIKTTGVFVNEELAAVKQAITTYQLKAVQLHGEESPEYCKSLLGEAEVIKAFGIDPAFDFKQLDAYAAVVDYFLFDTKTPQHGGSGQTFSWALLQNYTLTKPYFLSGGIGPESVNELLQIDDDRLYAIDVNSRFETAPGLKDIEELKKFKNLLCR
jgi:phosphoribosylanthranilate isomerase